MVSHKDSAEIGMYFRGRYGGDYMVIAHQGDYENAGHRALGHDGDGVLYPTSILLSTGNYTQIAKPNDWPDPHADGPELKFEVGKFYAGPSGMFVWQVYALEDEGKASTLVLSEGEIELGVTLVDRSCVVEIDRPEDWPL